MRGGVGGVMEVGGMGGVAGVGRDVSTCVCGVGVVGSVTEGKRG